LLRISELDRERQDLAAAVRDEELKELVASMEQVGGDGATSHPDDYEQQLRQTLKRTEQVYNLTESTQNAIVAFSDKLRDEARQFSMQFLAPLNTLIDDFNEALLARPGGSVRLNASYHVDKTKYDMGLHYRDLLYDALFDTDLAPQLVLSEGQLAANGFSILCAASKAYLWSRWRSLLLDDPLQHNDIIHTAAFVDLMRNLVELQGYQLIMSSHDRAESEFIRRKFAVAGLPC
jgi:hypothetical protein